MSIYTLSESYTYVLFKILKIKQIHTKMNLLCNLPCKGVQDVIASSQVPANLAQLQALELRSEAAAAKRNLHDNDETASDDIKVVILLEFQSIAQRWKIYISCPVGV
jgi:hypothetical protein